MRAAPVGNNPAVAPPAPAMAVPAQGGQQDPAMSALSAALRLLEQILFVFVASLWPNAVGRGPPPIPPQVVRPINPPPPAPAGPPPPGDDSGAEDNDDVAEEQAGQPAPAVQNDQEDGEVLV